MSDSWEIAAFRFEMISALLDVNLTRAQKRRIIRDRTKRAVQWPDSKKARPIGKSTLFRWLQNYREKGFLGLMPKARKDKGLARSDRSLQVNYALGLLYEQPDRSLTQLMLYLELEFGKLSMSRSTLSRDLHAHPAFQGILQRRKGTDKKLRHLYETDQPHDIWQLDAKGPFPVTLINGQTVRVHVLSILDDFSRYILAAIIAAAENIEAAVRVFRLAASKWGIALRMQFDRASAYDSKVFRTALAYLGVHRNWVKSRNPAAQGKIEAYHRSLKRWFVNELPNQEVVDLEHLEALLQATISLVYNRHQHREIKMTPEQALAQRISTRRVGAAELAQAFKISTRAKSHPTTGQLSLPNGLFRVPARWAGKRCDFRYDPVNKDEAALIIDDEHQLPLQPFTKKRPFDDQKADEKRGTGQLQKLLDIWQGHTRPNAQPGFGLPEVFREFSRLLQRSVPIDQREATAIEAFYRKTGPLPAEPFRQAIDRTADVLGANRALNAYLQYLDRLVQAQKKTQPGGSLMNPTTHFAFADFARAIENLENTFRNEADRYLLLTGETGVGKTWLCRQLQTTLDRCRYRVLYFSHARHLSATGLIRVLAGCLRLPTRRSHSETLQGLIHALCEQPHQLLIWFDEAHELADETLLEARSLAESDLADNCPVRILLIGLPPLRDRLQGIATLWRRIVVREELTGLTFDELPPFIEHHFGAEKVQLICQEGMRILFERARGIPGLIVPMFRKILADSEPNAPINPLTLDDILQRWELA